MAELQRREFAGDRGFQALRAALRARGDSVPRASR